MMALRGQRILGIAAEDGGLLLAELRVAGQRSVLTRVAEFDFPKGVSLDEPERLGAALRAFLRQRRVSARRAILGIPARWLLAREKALPAASQEAFLRMARLEAEQAFAGGGSDLVVDCTDDASGGETRAVLMVATARKRLEQLTALTRASGLEAQAATPTIVALGASGQPAAGQELTLYLRPRYAEVAVREGSRFRVLRHLPAAGEGGASGEWATGVGDRVRQLVSLLPQDEGALAPGELVIWDGVTPREGDLLGLRDCLSLPTTVRTDLSALGVARAPSIDEHEAARFAAPVALALAAVRPGGPVVDLLHSRLAPPRESALGRRLAWAVVVAAALVVAGVALVDDWRRDQAEVAALREQIEGLRPDLEAAEGIVGKASLARKWYDRRPRFLDCLRELTLAFPERGSIWATSIAVREDMRAVVSGKSVDEKTVLEVLDGLKQSSALAEAKLLHLREAGGRGREVSFAIRFTFVGSE